MVTQNTRDKYFRKLLFDIQHGDVNAVKSKMIDWKRMYDDKRHKLMKYICGNVRADIFETLMQAMHPLNSVKIDYLMIYCLYHENWNRLEYIMDFYKEHPLNVNLFMNREHKNTQNILTVLDILRKRCERLHNQWWALVSFFHHLRHDFDLERIIDAFLLNPAIFEMGQVVAFLLRDQYNNLAETLLRSKRYMAMEKIDIDGVLLHGNVEGILLLLRYYHKGACRLLNWDAMVKLIRRINLEPLLDVFTEIGHVERSILETFFAEAYDYINPGNMRFLKERYPEIDVFSALMNNDRFPLTMFEANHIENLVWCLKAIPCLTLYDDNLGQRKNTLSHHRDFEDLLKKNFPEAWPCKS